MKKLILVEAFQGDKGIPVCSNLNEEEHCKLCDNITEDSYYCLECGTGHINEDGLPIPLKNCPIHYGEPDRLVRESISLIQQGISLGYVAAFIEAKDKLRKALGE